jgi:hypothetical protein
VQKRFRRCLTVREVELIREFHAEGVPRKTIAAMFRCSVRRVCDFIHGNFTTEWRLTA